MATQAFIATYKDRRGKEKSLKLKAADLASAKRSLRQRGILALSLKADSGSSEKVQRGLSLSLEKAPGVKEKAVFASQMAALVSAGVPIVRSLEILAEQQKLPMFKRALQRLSLDVNQGSSLGSALRRWPQVFDALSVAMVEAGEAGGVLEEVLKRLAKLLEDNAKLQNQIRGALGYPVTVLVIAIAVFLGMTIFLIPTFAGIFEDLGAELPAFTQLMVNLSALLRSTFSLYLAGGLLLLLFLLKRAYGTKLGRRRMDGLMLRLPLFGDLIRKTASPVLPHLQLADASGGADLDGARHRARHRRQPGALRSDRRRQDRSARRRHLEPGLGPPQGVPLDGDEHAADR